MGLLKLQCDLTELWIFLSQVEEVLSNASCVGGVIANESQHTVKNFGLKLNSISCIELLCQRVTSYYKIRRSYLLFDVWI